MASNYEENYEECVRILREGFESGINASIDSRKEHLKKLKSLLIENEDAICEALKDDLGKCKFESITHEINSVISEIDLAISNLKSWTKPTKVTRYILQATDSAYTISEPLGVVLIIGAWNFPINLLLAPLVGAIAAGNTVLLKPSEVASSTERLILELFDKYFDSGFLKAVHADNLQMEKLLKIRFDHIFFTGSTIVGQIIFKAAAEHLTPVVLELGGKSPAVVDSEFDLSIASKRICWGKLMNNGQICVAPDYVIIVGDKDRRSKFTSEYVKAIAEFYGTDIINNDDYGRIVNEKHFKRLTSLLESTEGRIVCGGKYEMSSRFIEPTLIEAEESDITMKQEIFGPILPIITLPCLEDAIKLIRRHEKPLVSYLFSDSKKAIERFQAVESGTLTINDTIMHMTLDSLPFGGVGKSGMGRYHGKFTFDAFTHQKAVLHRSSAFEKLLWMRYPPFKGTDKLAWVHRMSSKIRMPL